jgi:hypothetical protein
MKEFALIFRMNISSKEAQPSPAQMQAYMQQWNEWISGISKKDRLAGGNHFSADGMVLKPGKVTISSPYTVNKESVAGYIIILASDINDAKSIAAKCPILQGEETSVEIRETEDPG